MEKDKYDIETIIERLKFKSLPYDVEANYRQLQQNIIQEKLSVFQKKLRVWKWAGIAACLALITVSSLHFLNLQSPPQMVWYETTAVPDAKTKVVLPDNSIVWLNANASLRYPNNFPEDERSVYVSGDATFEVQKDQKPFIVVTNGVDIRVLGTRFNVLTNEDEEQIEITLLEGKIALHKQGNHNNDKPDQILNPNEQAVFSKSNNDITVSTIRTETVTSWMTGVFSFQGNTLTQIMAELERAFHTKIRIENETMKAKTLNATFDNNETLDEILSILQMAARYEIEKRKGVVYIK